MITRDRQIHKQWDSVYNTSFFIVNLHRRKIKEIKAESKTVIPYQGYSYSNGLETFDNAFDSPSSIVHFSPSFQEKNKAWMLNHLSHA